MVRTSRRAPRYRTTRNYLRKAAGKCTFLTSAASIQETDPKQIKNAGEYPIRCTPIIFRGFSENAKTRILEAAIKPQNRTLGPIDVSLEDGVTFFTEVRLSYAQSYYLTCIIFFFLSRPGQLTRKKRRTFEMLRARVRRQLSHRYAAPNLL